jgi:capsular polysaccharide transport system permease protein
MPEKRKKIKKETVKVFTLKYLFLVVVLIPTFLAVIYYLFIASDIYVSQSKFSIYSDKNSVPTLDPSNVASLALSSPMNSNNLEQLLITSEYIKSYDSLQKLNQRVNLFNIYSKDKSLFSNVPDVNSNKEEFLDYYLDMIEVKVNRDASLLDIRVKAFNSEDANFVMQNLNKIVEDFVNEMMERVEQNRLAQANRFVDNAEARIAENQLKLSDFSIRNGTVDPTEKIQVKLALIQTLEERKAELMIQKSESKSLVSSSSISMKNLDKKIQNLNSLISQTKLELVQIQDNQGDLIREFEKLKLEEEFAKEEYKLTLLNLQETIKNNSSQDKFIVEVLKPTIPDIAAEPERFIEILKIFIISLLSASILILIVASIRDHIIV